MSIVASPSTSSVADETQFSVTVTLGDDDAVSPAAVVITGVTSSDPGVTATFSNTQFTLTGKTTTTVSKSISFIDGENVKKTVTNFAAVPIDYKAVYSFTPPTSGTYSMSATVKLTNHPTFTYVVTVTVSPASTIASFSSLVKNGAF